MGRILLVEDNKEVVRIIQESLKKFEVVVCHDLATTRIQLQNQAPFDLILLDVGLPDGDGFGFLAQIKNQFETPLAPVIFLTARSETPDIVMGFSLGAEDYIAKPFNPFELRARIEAKMKSLSLRRKETENLQIGNLQLNLATFKAALRQGVNSKEIEFTPLEFKILCFFAQNLEVVMNRNQLIDQIWGTGVAISDRSVDTHMSNLRKKIKDSGYNIESIYGVGYSLRKSETKAA